jgi:hypothetical protein
MFRFTIRDLLWLMVVVGMGVGWWSQLQRANEELLAHKTWEKSARTVARSSSFSVRFKDDGTIVVAPKGFDWNTGRMELPPAVDPFAEP